MAIPNGATILQGRLDACICIYNMSMCEMFLKIVISIYVCVYVVIKFLINKFYKVSWHKCKPLFNDNIHQENMSV